jgi:hypothetical protein
MLQRIFRKSVKSLLPAPPKKKKTPVPTNSWKDPDTFYWHVSVTKALMNAGKYFRTTVKMVLFTLLPKK